MFGGGDDDDAAGAVPKRKLVKLDEEDGAKEENDEAEDKKRIIKSLIERIPTAKDELFAYSLDWSIVDQVSEQSSLFVRFSFLSDIMNQHGQAGRKTRTEHHVSMHQLAQMNCRNYCRCLTL